MYNRNVRFMVIFLVEEMLGNHVHCETNAIDGCNRFEVVARRIDYFMNPL